MKRLMCLGVGVSIVACAIVAVGAQAPASADKPSQSADKSKSVTITGCLAAGTDANTFTLNDAMPGAAAKEQSKEAPKAGEMKSYRVTVGESSVKLTDHVGHRVTLTGTVAEGAPGAAGAATPGAAGTAGTTGGGKATPTLNVTAMKHVAPTCTQ